MPVGEMDDLQQNIVYFVLKHWQFYLNPFASSDLDLHHKKTLPHLTDAKSLDDAIHHKTKNLYDNKSPNQM